jgi:hypothetical protein
MRPKPLNGRELVEGPEIAAEAPPGVRVTQMWGFPGRGKSVGKLDRYCEQATVLLLLQ